MPLSNILRRTILPSELRWLKTRPRSLLISYGMSERDISSIRDMEMPIVDTITIPPEIEMYAERVRERILAPRRDAVDTSIPVQQPQSEEALIEDSTSDVDRKYMHCYANINNTLYIAIGIYTPPNTQKIQIDFMDVLTESRMRVDYSPSLFTHPKLGYVNHNNHALFLERLHRRSSNRYKRGFYHENVRIYSVSHRELISCYNTYLTNTNEYSNIQIIKQIGTSLYNREYPSYNTALESLLNLEKLSCAVSSSICLQLNSLTNKFMILKNRWVIGEYNTKRNIWIVYNDLFKDDFNSLGIPFEVSTNE